jgi:hypothetical protein
VFDGSVCGHFNANNVCRTQALPVAASFHPVKVGHAFFLEIAHHPPQELSRNWMSSTMLVL